MFLFYFDAFNQDNAKRNGLESEPLINGNNSPLSRPSLHHIGSEVIYEGNLVKWSCENKLKY